MSNFELNNFFIAFQHKLFFHLVNDLFSYFEDPRRSVNIAIESENKWNFDPACFQKKLVDTLSNVELKISLSIDST